MHIVYLQQAQANVRKIESNVNKQTIKNDKRLTVIDKWPPMLGNTTLY